MTDAPTAPRTRGLVGGPRPRWLAATLVGLRSETSTARSLTFEVPGWPGHLAGQHVDVRLTAADGYAAQRAYSIATPTDAERLTITVQVVDNGEVSPYLVEDMELGDQLEVRGPIGGWFVWSPSPQAPVEQPLLLVGGGSGVVPLMTMVRERSRTGSRAPFRLVYSVREPAQVMYADELARRAPDDGVAVDIVHTRSAPPGSPRPVGRVTAADLATPPEAGWPTSVAPRAYVCGPSGFVDHVIGRLLDLGHPASAIRAERFGATGA